LESTSNAINATLYDKLNFDVLTDDEDKLSASGFAKIGLVPIGRHRR
jgi:hypothetical protein